jgi:divalent metal cation (Fe/Co/Zn/Cd) transporter
VNRESWLHRARLLAWFTVAYNLLEGGLSIRFGLSDDSVALWGFGLDSLVEVASGLVVLWRLRDAAGSRPGARERRATTIIGWLFVILALGVAWGAAHQLVSQGHPDTGLPGILIALASLLTMFFLWRAKTAAARALDSATLAGDAACTMACLVLSGVLLLGSLVSRLVPALGWVDGAAALVLAILIGREGWQGIRAARRPDFTGGCGCH